MSKARPFRHGNYEMWLPRDWVDASTVIHVCPPGEDGYGPSVTVTREDLPSRTDVEAYAAKMLQGLEEGLADQGYRVIDEAPCRAGPIYGYRREHAFTPPNLGFEVRQMQLYLIRRKEAYTVTATARADRWAETAELLEGILATFSFVRPL
jgi:hypothetical protein